VVTAAKSEILASGSFPRSFFFIVSRASERAWRYHLALVDTVAILAQGKPSG
jgi:hypothetical protein